MTSHKVETRYDRVSRRFLRHIKSKTDCFHSLSNDFFIRIFVLIVSKGLPSRDTPDPDPESLPGAFENQINAMLDRSLTSTTRVAGRKQTRMKTQVL